MGGVCGGGCGVERGNSVLGEVSLRGGSIFNGYDISVSYGFFFKMYFWEVRYRVVIGRSIYVFLGEVIKYCIFVFEFDVEGCDLVCVCELDGVMFDVIFRVKISCCLLGIE